MAGDEEESVPHSASNDEHESAGHEQSEAREVTEVQIHSHGDESSTAAASESEVLTSQLEETLRRIREALEQKDFETIGQLIGLDSIFINGHPEPTSSIVANVKEMAAHLCDFEGVLLRVNRNQIDDTKGRFSLRFRIMWSSCEDWEEFDLYLDAHAGYEHTADGWKLQYLSLNQSPAQVQSKEHVPAAPPPPPPEAKAPAPVQPAHAEAVEAPRTPIPPRPKAARLPREVRRLRAKSASVAPRAEVHPQAAPTPAKAADKPLTDDYFTAAAAQYFGQVAPEKAPEMKPAVLGSSVGGKHHLLYVPIVMHEDLIKKIVGGE
jgi:hypothetical protein